MTQAQASRWAALACALAGVALTGCGNPGAPQPPSLNLPDPVSNLAASRTGDQVSLTWTMPRRDTDKLVMKTAVPIRVHICRKEGDGSCEAAGADLSLDPAAAGTFTETLPAPLATGAPRPLIYFVELKNKNGRSAGPSNPAAVLAGQAPSAIAGLRAEIRKEGVVLIWTPDAAAQPATVIRLHRKLLTPAPAKPQSQPGILAPAPEPLEESLLVEAAPNADRALGRALDKDIHFGETYEYRVQRVARVKQADQTIELAGPLSAPVRIEALDIFPPAVPTGLAAVASKTGTETSIDLSWQPNTETDLAGYAVYRREGDGPWQRISSQQPEVGPSFHDDKALPGHTYRYAVTAIDQGGHESHRSVETQESVPQP